MDTTTDDSPLLRFNFIDRRLNPKGKSLNNRQRFLERVKKKVENSVAKGLQKRGISDEGNTDVTISQDGIEEPHLQYDTSTGVWDYLLPGNKEFTVGDTIPRPPGGGGGSGSGTAGQGESEDDFVFSITHDEYINAIFGDLELPDMVKQSQKQTINYVWRRAGFTPIGPASNLALEQTMSHSIARRIALKNPKYVAIAELEKELETETDEVRRLQIEMDIAELQTRARNIPFLDKVDLRYHNTTKHPQPNTQAVMVCLMDVSGSMTEHMKDLAKRFYILLYIFLKRQYKSVEVVFIRHTDEAKEVDEQSFFHDPHTGGTMVSTGYVEMARIVKERYPIDQWNIYCAQATDGDNYQDDIPNCRTKLFEIMPWLQYLTYTEIISGSSFGYSSSTTNLWSLIDEVRGSFPNKIALRHLKNREELIEVFRSLFKKKATA